MFISRKKELEKVKSFLSSEENAMLIYGKRRVGKTSLIQKAVEDSDYPVLFYQCTAESYEINLQAMTEELQETLSLSFLSFRSFYELFAFLILQNRKIVVVLDEYGELKKSYGALQADSMLQKIIDKLKRTKVKIIVSGSAVAAMKELLEEQNPLFNRFSYIIHLHEFDYYDASLFYPSFSNREKVSYYSVFGGSPNVLEFIDKSASLEENIENLLLDRDGRVRSFVEKSLLQEYSKLGPALSLFQFLGNGKKTYTEIKDKLDPGNTGNLSKLLEKFQKNETVGKVCPINRKNEKRRTFYKLNENLLRFYFTYVHSNRSQIEMTGPHAVFTARIMPSLDTFISYRFEDICRSYFSRLAKKNSLPGILDIGTYWYDDPRTRMNGEFDCVLEFQDGYDVYEVKFLPEAMTKEIALSEADSIRAIEAFKPRHIGFISVSGFDFSDSDFHLVTGDDLYASFLEE